MPGAPQAGQRTRSLSASGIMNSNTFIKGTGILQVLPLGLLLLSLLVPGSQVTEPSTTTTEVPATFSQITTSTSDSSSTYSGVSTTNSIATTRGITVTTTTHSSSLETTTALSLSISTESTPATSGGSSYTSSQSTPPVTSTTSASAGIESQSTIITSTSGNIASTTTTQSSTTTGISGISGSTTTLSSTYTTGGSPSTGHMTWNGTTMSNDTSKNVIYCPSFSCNHSDCYSMYMSQNTTPCADNAYCQLLKDTGSWHRVSCSKHCYDRCTNISQTNCTVNCCNSTGCLNSTFASMMMMTSTTGSMTSTATATSTTPTTTTTTQPTANKGNKCHNGTCTGATCYKDIILFSMCSSSQPHCQLKNESTDSTIKWTASCTNCTGYTACLPSGKAPCHLECCNATMTSCLWLNGTQNVPSFATRGPYLHTELMVCLLCVVFMAFLL